MSQNLPQQLKWHRYFIALALETARIPKDAATQVGAVIIGADRQKRPMGFTGVPRDILDSDERFNNTTLKYMPEFPDRFDRHQDALSYCRKFFQWNNEEHYHTGIALLTPSTMHFRGAVEVIDQQRQAVLALAYVQNPPHCHRVSSTRHGTGRGVGQSTHVDPETRKASRGPLPLEGMTPLAHSQPGYPSSSCVPAELDCVSPGNYNLKQREI